MTLPNKKIVNSDQSLAIVSNKAYLFNAISGTISIPDFTVRRDVAEQWVKAGKKLVFHPNVTAKNSKFVGFISSIFDFNFQEKDGQMFTVYIPKKEEYRVHVVDGHVVGCFQKEGTTPKRHQQSLTKKIRNHYHRYVFRKVQKATVNPEILTKAIHTIDCLGLRFGTVDLIWNEFSKKSYVLGVKSCKELLGSEENGYEQTFSTFYLPKEIAEESKEYEEKKNLQPHAKQKILAEYAKAGQMGVLAQHPPKFKPMPIPEGYVVDEYFPEGQVVDIGVEDDF